MLRLAVIVILVACGGRQVAKAPAPQGMRVIVISIDGLMPETYLEPDALGLAVPTLRSMVARGAYARRVESVFPTVTYPAHVTMVTGVPPSVHGITTNRAPDPLDRNKEGWRWYAEDIKVPTLWQAVEAQRRPVAIVTWPVTVGADVTFRVPEYWRVGTPDDQKLLRGLSTQGLLDKVAREEPALWKSLVPPDVKDAAQFAIAKYLVAHERVELMLVHGWELDDAQHEHGPRSAEAKRAVENADRLLGELLAVIERSPQRERTIVVVVSDHGFAAYDKEIRPYVVFAERGLVDAKSARAAISANGGIALVYLLDAGARAQLADAITALPGIARVIPKAELAALGADPDAEYALVAAPGHVFSETRTAPVLADKPGKGHHGYLPTDPAMAASFIAVGPGVPKRDLGAIRMTDIAPTLARWLAVPLPTATGKPIDGLR